MDALRKASEQLSGAELRYLQAQLFYPVLLMVAFIITAAVHSVVTARREEDVTAPTVTGPGGKPLPMTKRKRENAERTEDDNEVSLLARRFFQLVSALLVFTCIGNGVNIAVHAVSERGHGDDSNKLGWWCGQEKTIYVVGSAVWYSWFTFTLFDWTVSPTLVHGIMWAIGLLGDSIIYCLFLTTVSGPHHVIINVKEGTLKLVTGFDSWDLIDVVLGALRLGLMLLLLGVYATMTVRQRHRRSTDKDETDSCLTDAEVPDETTPLLGNEHSNRSLPDSHPDHRTDDDTNNSNTNGVAEIFHKRDEDAAFYRKKTVPRKTWFEYCQGYSVFFPYLWPNKVPRLQLLVGCCFILLILQRIVNILVPLQIGIVTNKLADDTNSVRTMPWNDLTLLIVYKILQGQSGMLGSIRGMLWLPVSQHTYKALTAAAFEHVHSLSLDFHLSKRTGEVLSALNKGAAINNFLEQATFQVLPMLIDLFVAIGFFYVQFNATYAMFVSIITFLYLHLTIRMAATRADQRREMVNADREEEAIKNDSITSYETVKYFNAEQFEYQRYRKAVDKFQAAEYNVIWGINHMNICQSVVFMCGMQIAVMCAAWEVTQGTRTVGDFVLLITYLGQLQGPLNFFGTFYRTVQQAMISGERLLELFKIQPSVQDRPGAVALENCKGHLRWSNVKFYYDKRKPALHNLNFECTPGTTTAFVGESGGGKSTVFRLMFRYYQCHEGRIEIDGQDVKDLTIDSVRRSIGVVPQDTLLFNESLMYNIRYANPGASDDDVYEACRSAAIHDRIMSFPDGYNTNVGERGLRLSGGEKQRVAIARLILKNPRIILLDEATSALDGETEEQIQAKLISGNLGKDRTLLVIAHRLSTITHADQIIVLKKGTIVEKGTHEELLAKNGHYKAMWVRHCRAEAAAEEAKVAIEKAELLLSQANIPTSSHTDDRSDGCHSLASSTYLQTEQTTPGGTPRDDQSSASSSSGDDDQDGEGSANSPPDGPREPRVGSFRN